MTLGQKIKKRMEHQNINVKTLSDLTGIAPATLYSFFRRDSDSINISALVKIAAALETSIDDLIGETSTEITKPSYFVSDKEIEFLETYRNADAQTKSVIRRMLAYSDEINKLHEKKTKK